MGNNSTDINQLKVDGQQFNQYWKIFPIIFQVPYVIYIVIIHIYFYTKSYHCDTEIKISNSGARWCFYFSTNFRTPFCTPPYILIEIFLYLNNMLARNFSSLVRYTVYSSFIYNFIYYAINSKISILIFSCW
jgi:hypothetical protein